MQRWFFLLLRNGLLLVVVDILGLPRMALFLVLSHYAMKHLLKWTKQVNCAERKKMVIMEDYHLDFHSGYDNNMLLAYIKNNNKYL